MRRWSIALCLTALCLTALCACAKEQPAPPREADGAAADEIAPAKAEAPVWRYEVETASEVFEHTAADGTVIATKKTELPRLTLKCDGDAAGQEPPEDMQAVCDAFNSGATVPELWDIDVFKEAEGQYEWKKLEDIEFFPLADELTVEKVYRSGDLLSVLGQAYVDLGGAHPDWGYVSWNFDLAAGGFFTPVSLTNDPEALRGTIVDEVVSEIYSSEWYEGYYEDFEEILRAKEDFAAFFDEGGMTVYFEEYEIAPHALGVPEFTIPYAKLSRYLNERGARLLDLSVEDRVMGDYYEAEEMWTWFDGNMPLDDTDIRTVPSAEADYDIQYYRAAVPDVTTLAELREKLLTRFSEAAADRRMEMAVNAEYPLLREFDGALYVLPAGRGDDLTIASVDYAVETGGGTNGKIVVTVHRRDFDEETGELGLTGETDTVELPFVLTEDGARFTEFESIW